MTQREIKEFFEEKPRSFRIFQVIAERISAMGPSQLSVASQISFGRQRKFVWFWLYNQTRKDPNGVPHLMLALDHQVVSDRIRQVDQIGKHRWNHQIVVRSEEDASSEWLGELLAEAYQYAGGPD